MTRPLTDPPPAALRDLAAAGYVPGAVLGEYVDATGDGRSVPWWLAWSRARRQLAREGRAAA